MSCTYGLNSAIDKNGNKVIFINSFCESFEDLTDLDITNELSGEETKINWHDYLIEVSDGGKCFWQMKVNLTSKKYFELIINGEG